MTSLGKIFWPVAAFVYFPLAWLVQRAGRCLRRPPREGRG
jgi:hypothetical protein